MFDSGLVSETLLNKKLRAHATVEQLRSVGAGVAEVAQQSAPLQPINELAVRVTPMVQETIPLIYQPSEEWQVPVGRHPVQQGTSALKDRRGDRGTNGLQRFLRSIWPSGTHLSSRGPWERDTTRMHWACRPRGSHGLQGSSRSPWECEPNRTHGPFRP